MASFIRPPALIPLPRMEWLRERIDTSLKLPKTLLFQIHVLKPFWADFVSIACFFINQMPSSVLNLDTPYHILFPNKPLFPTEPQISRCTCFVRDVRPHVSKHDPKSLKCIFLGYSQVQKGYRCYCPSLRRYLVLVYVTFLENAPFSLPPTHTSQGGGRRVACLYYCFTHCLSRPASCPCSGKTSYHSGLHLTPTPPSLEPSTSCFDIRFNSQ